MSNASIYLYGPVVDESWWSDETVTPKNVKEQLDRLGNAKEIDIHINSPGGSVFAGQAIHNLFKQHGARINIYIDGLAASIASIIAMAGDKIIMPPGAMMMIHNPLLSLWGSYQAENMREMADFLDKIRDALVATYASRCSQKTTDEIVALMGAETWLTAEEAVDQGWADEIIGLNVDAKLDGKLLNIAGRKFDLSAFGKFPVNLVESAIKNQEEDEELNLEELKAKYPELYNQILNEGIEKERQRMKTLDELCIPGSDKLINKAKFETIMTAEQAAVEIVKAEKTKRESFLKDIKADTEESGINQVPNAAPEGKDKEIKDLEQMATIIAGGANQRRG